jgi:hypothetical protein
VSDYQIGLDALIGQIAAPGTTTPAASGPASGLGGGIYTPDAIRNRLEYINTAWTTLKVDIAADTVVSAAFRASFMREYVAWTSFYRTQTGSWFNLLWGSVLDQGEDYLRTLHQWRDAYRRLGRTPTGPEPLTPAAPTVARAISEATTAGQGALTTVAVIAAILVAGVIVVEVSR